MSVILFPCTTHVAVLVRGEDHWIALAKPGEKLPALQVAYPTLQEAVREAQEGAALCGWPFVGVVYDTRTEGAA